MENSTIDSCEIFQPIILDDDSINLVIANIDNPSIESMADDIADHNEIYQRYCNK